MESTIEMEGAVEEAAATATSKRQGLLLYLLIGIGFGFVLTKAEAVSWFRIQEMFRFQSFHMYGCMAR